MALPVREQILAGLFTALTNGLTGVTVYRNRRFDIPVDRLDAVDISDAGNSRTDDTAIFGCTLFTMDVVVNIRSQGPNDPALGTKINTLAAQVSAIVLADYSQAGLAIDTHAGQQSALEKLSDPGSPIIGGCELMFQIEFQTITGDLTRSF